MICINDKDITIFISYTFRSAVAYIHLCADCTGIKQYTFIIHLDMLYIHVYKGITQYIFLIHLNILYIHIYTGIKQYTFLIHICICISIYAQG